MASGGGAAGGSEQGREPQYPSQPGSQGGGRTPPTDTISPQGPGFSRKDFIKSYADMVARTWTDESFLDLILASPADALAGAGMPTAPGATFRIVQHKITGSGQIKDQVDAWVEGNRTGLYDLFLPMRPDDVDFEPGGGGDPNACAGGFGCCCCPCCCCT